MANVKSKKNHNHVSQGIAVLFRQKVRFTKKTKMEIINPKKIKQVSVDFGLLNKHTGIGNQSKMCQG